MRSTLSARGSRIWKSAIWRQNWRFYSSTAIKFPRWAAWSLRQIWSKLKIIFLSILNNFSSSIYLREKWVIIENLKNLKLVFRWSSFYRPTIFPRFPVLGPSTKVWNCWTSLAIGWQIWGVKRNIFYKTLAIWEFFWWNRHFGY